MNARLSSPDTEGMDLTAAEYVLGVLDADGIRQARRRLRVDSVFAGEVDAWEQYFQPWLDAIEPVAAPASAWPRIAATLGWGATRPVGDRTNAASTPRVGFWRGFAFGGMALAGVGALALVFALRDRPVPAPLPAPPPVVTTQTVMPDMVAAIAGDDGRAALVASIDSSSGAMTLAPAGELAVPTGQAAELWLIPAGGAPQSLGVFDPAQAGTMEVPTALRAGLTGEAVLAVSLEPAGGSPTGQPTGPVVAKGALRGV